MGFLQKLKVVSPEEKQYVETITSRFTDDERDMFLARYTLRRKNLITYLAFLIIPNLVFLGGFHRFYAGDKLGFWKNKIVGFIYFLSAGMCGVGALYDIFTSRRLIAERNMEIADEVRSEVIERYTSLMKTDQMRKELQNKLNSLAETSSHIVNE